MKKSNCTTPRVFSLMRMMSHHKSLVNVLFMDGVLSWSMFLLFLEGVQSCVMAPELQEDWMGTQGISQLLFIRFTPEFLSGATRVNPGHSTRIARGLGWYNY